MLFNSFCKHLKSTKHVLYILVFGLGDVPISLGLMTLWKYNLKQAVKMGRNANIVIYVIAMVVTVVAADILFFRHRFWERLIANIGIILVYVALYLRFLKR